MGNKTLYSRVLNVLLSMVCCSALTVFGAESRRHTFDLLDFQIDGNTRLPQIELEKAVYPFLGPERNMADIEAARSALEKAYRAAGYRTIYVDVPPQELKDGRVRILVTEGYIVHLKVTGLQHHSDEAIRKQVTELAAGNVPNFNNLQQQLGILNSDPDVQVTPVLREGHAPGAVEAELQVKDKLPIHGSIELNDRYTAHTAHARLSAGLHYDNLWQRGHSFGMSITTAPGNSDQVKVWQANYMLPWDDTRVALYALHSDNAVSAVGDIDVLGAGSILGVRWYSPGFVEGNWVHTFSGGIDRKSFEQTVNFGTGTTAIGYETPIRYQPWQLQWRAANNASAQAGQNSLGLSLNFALRGFGNDDEQFEDNRYKARASYLYLRPDFQTAWHLGQSLAVVRASGQWASQPLVSNEQFALGGVDSVRGYTEAATAGDRGGAASFEWQSAAAALPGKASNDASIWRWLVFYDWGSVTVSEPLPEQIDHFVLSSWGGGIRAQVWPHLTASVDIAFPLKPDPAGYRDHLRLHSRLAMEF